MRKCPECGSTRIRMDAETGEACCEKCGLVIDVLPTEEHPVNLSNNITLEHLPDKNLPTTFEPSDAEANARKQFYALKRIDQKCRTIRESASTYYNVTMKVRSILERRGYPSGRSLDLIVNLAAKIASKNSLQRIEKMYEALAYYALIRIDKHRYLLSGSRKLLEFISGSRISEIARFGFESWRYMGNGTWETYFTIPESQNIPDIWFAIVTVTIDGAKCMVRAPFKTVFSTINSNGTPHPYICYKNSYMLSLRTDKKAYEPNETLKLTLTITEGEEPVDKDHIKDISTTIKSGGWFLRLEKTYKRLCASLNEPISPYPAEEFFMRDNELPPELRIKASELIEGNDFLMKRGGYPPMSPALKAAVAAQLLTRRPIDKVAKIYGVNPNTLKSKISTIKRLREHLI